MDRPSFRSFASAWHPTWWLYAAASVLFGLNYHSRLSAVIATALCFTVYVALAYVAGYSYYLFLRRRRD